MTGRVLVFGTFDELHQGHLYFLEQAKREGDFLFVSVARDEHVMKLKNKKPKFNEKRRLEELRKLEIVNHAELSDKKLGSFEILESVKPDIIVLGFDQNELEEVLIKWLQDQKKQVQIKKLSKHYPSTWMDNER